ncbi:MAG: hypothetical protein ACNI25_07400 [Halarcobacter sp.]
MNNLVKIKNILNHHKCKCYEIDQLNKKLIYLKDNNCYTLNPVIAEITGYLVCNNIEYTMTKKLDIILEEL